MKPAHLFVVGLCSILFAGCETTPRTDPNAASINLDANKPGLEDTMFVQGALATAADGLETTRLVIERTQNLDLKLLAQRMYDDHVRTERELSLIARQEKIPISVEPRQTGELQYLQRLSGPEFDRTYIQQLLEKHHIEIKKCQAAARNARATSIRSFAAEMGPTLREHVRVAENISKVASYGVEINEPAGAERQPFYEGDPELNHQFNE